VCVFGNVDKGGDAGVFSPEVGVVVGGGDCLGFEVCGEGYDSLF